MIKIIHVISSLPRGGRERQLATIVANTRMELYPTIILYFNKYQNSYIDEYGLADFAIQITAKGKVARLKELHRILKNENPDIVYTWGNGESLSVLLLKQFHRFIFINGSVRHGIRSRKSSHILRSIVLHLGGNIVANSKAGLRANNLNRGFVLYNGIDNRFLDPIIDRSTLRSSLLDIAVEIPVLISVANMVPYKDYFSVITALSKIKNEGIRFFYVILGDGPMKREINDMISKEGLSEDILLPGNVQNVQDYLKVSDVYIHSSKGEGCSNAILEAMAAGLPVIASNTGGTPEIVNEKNGFLFNYMDVGQLTEKIKYLLLNNDMSSTMGLRSKEKVKANYSIESMMSSYYDIVNEVFHRKDKI